MEIPIATPAEPPSLTVIGHDVAGASAEAPKTS